MTHNGEELPVLSASAKKMKIDKLLAAPLPTYDSSVPGSYLWTKIAFWMCRRVSSVQFRTSSTSTVVPQSVGGAGAMCCGWHTNGLMDPLGIFLNHPKEFVVGARHDLVYPAASRLVDPSTGRPTRRSQSRTPCGGCTDEEALHLNGRSLLALSSGIAHGFGCVLFPEGTSHSQSLQIRFKTGPVRTVLAVACAGKSQRSAASALGSGRPSFPMPRTLPNRSVRRIRRPIHLNEAMIPTEMVEASAEEVGLSHRRRRCITFAPTAGKAADVDAEHIVLAGTSALHIVAHARARAQGTTLKSWEDEVLAAREVRRTWPNRTHSFPPEPLVDGRSTRT